MTHAPVCEAAQKKAGIGRNLIRLSVGLESGEDLVEDLLEALQAVDALKTPERLAAVGT
jgi:cystathionine beta-lyase/cystathionine gamma-synthase